MVEPLAVASAVNAALGTALKFSTEIWNYIDDLKNAPARLEAIGGNLKLCRSYLDKLIRLHARKIQHSNADGYDDTQTLTDTLDAFKKVCRQLSQLLRPYTKSGGLHFWNRVRWQWHSREFKQLHSELQKHQATMNLILTYDTREATRQIGFDTQRILRILQRQKGAQSVSDEDEEELRSEFERLRQVEHFVRSQGSYDVISAFRSIASASPAMSSPTVSDVGPEPASIDAIIDPRSSGAPLPPPQLSSPPVAETPWRQRSPPSGHASAPRQPQPARAASKEQEGPYSAAHFQSRAHWDDPSFAARQNRGLTNHSMSGQLDRSLQPSQAAGNPGQKPLYYYVEDALGRRIARPQRSLQPDHPHPELQEMRSDPGLVNRTWGMTDPERRAYIEGHLSGLNANVERTMQFSRSAGSAGDRSFGFTPLRITHDSPPTPPVDETEIPRLPEMDTASYELNRLVERPPWLTSRHPHAEGVQHDINDLRPGARRIVAAGQQGVDGGGTAVPSVAYKTAINQERSSRHSHRAIRVHRDEPEANPHLWRREPVGQMYTSASRAEPSGFYKENSSSEQPPPVSLQSKPTNIPPQSRASSGVNTAFTKSSEQAQRPRQKPRSEQHSSFLNGAIPRKDQRPDIRSSTLAALEISTGSSMIR